MAENFVPKNYNTDGGDTSVFSGVIRVENLPTADPGVSGQLWNSSGNIKVSAQHFAPDNTAAPAITGTATVGSTLTTTNGTWTGTPTPTYARKWLANGVVIAGATATTYVLTSAEVGKVVTVEVTASNSMGSAVKLSNATAAVAAS